MKGKIIVLILLIFLFFAFIVGKHFLYDSRNASGTLEIVSTPSASVFVDNLPIGDTPLEQSMKIGEYQVKIIPHGEGTDTTPWQGNITIHRNTVTYIGRELSSSELSSAGIVMEVVRMESKPSNNNVGQIYVQTEPSGAVVYLDGDERAVAPIILSDVKKGEHELSLEMGRFERRSYPIFVEAGFRVNVTVKLPILQSAQQSIVRDVLPSATDESQLEGSNESTASETDSAIDALSESSADTSSGNQSRLAESLTITITDTETGWLNVRERSTINSKIVAKVNPGDVFTVLDEDTEWYKIEYETGLFGWITRRYTEKQ